MGLLDAPLLGAPDAEIRAAHADHAVGVVGTACALAAAIRPGAADLVVFAYACVLLAGTACLGSYTPSAPKPGTAMRASTPQP